MFYTNSIEYDFEKKCDILNVRCSLFNNPLHLMKRGLNISGGASVVCRLTLSWAAGRPKVSSLLLTTVGILLAGGSACIMPFWGSLLGQVFLMIIYGLTVGKSKSLYNLCTYFPRKSLTRFLSIKLPSIP